MKNKVFSFLFFLSFFPWNAVNAVEEKDYVAYLFTYFTGNLREEKKIRRFALSWR